MSQHIRFLKEFYGAQLLGIQGKKLFLTEAGKLLHSAALTMRNDELHLCGITFLYKKAAEGDLLRQTLFELPIDDFRLAHNLNFVFRKNSIFRKEYESLFQKLR